MSQSCCGNIRPDHQDSSQALGGGFVQSLVCSSYAHSKLLSNQSSPWELSNAMVLAKYIRSLHRDEWTRAVHKEILSRKNEPNCDDVADNRQDFYTCCIKGGGRRNSCRRD